MHTNIISFASFGLVLVVKPARQFNHAMYSLNHYH